MIQTLGVKLWMFIVNFRRAKVSPEKHAQKREWVNCFFASIDNFSQAGCYVVAVRDKIFYRGGVGDFFSQRKFCHAFSLSINKKKTEKSIRNKKLYKDEKTKLNKTGK